MNLGKIILGMGVIILLSGIVFYFQGQSVIGPKSSFMYSNPEWITNGLWIMIVGIVMLVTGAIVLKTSLRRLG